MRRREAGSGRREAARRLGPLAVVSIAAVSLAGALSCTDLSGSKLPVLSIQFDTLPYPSVVVGDTLRDSSGVIVHPVVHAFDFDGKEILPAPVFFLSPDSGVTVDSATGIIVADSLRSTPARIVATVGRLQAIQRINVTLRPDTIFGVNALDSLQYSIIDTTVDVSNALTIKLSHGVVPTDTAVASYIVSFAIVSQPEPNLADLVNDAGKVSLVDTTDGSGIAGRKIRLHPVALGSATEVDSIIVSATAKFRGVPVSGSPVRLVLLFKPRT